MLDSLRTARERSHVASILERSRRTLETAFAHSSLASIGGRLGSSSSSLDEQASPVEPVSRQNERDTTADTSTGVDESLEAAEPRTANEPVTTNEPRSAVTRATETSVVASRARAIQGVFTRAGRSARVVAAATVSAGYATSSGIYRWLTAEPDPEVIVIDLRETRTVGPVFVVLDRVIVLATAGLPTSSVASSVRSTTNRFSARPIRILSLCLLPALLSSLLLLTATGAITAPLAVVHGLLALAATIGTRSTTTLEDLRSTRTAALLRAAFEPPEPPERSADDSSSRMSDEREDERESRRLE
ncbi:hypothetical protein [Natronosalvus halobius]|uniref:hypothetical protein n=1 Tax=Natronosalvus halobius TaxID=2953746 RepID=UPI0020A0D056|nr:hypothetical protein [Natronosalvus halobius]USZ71508.1 hypothetical protein NGM15_15810 [Natronosalvus halobius]